MNFSKFCRSFVIGFCGFVHAVKAEQNMRIHCLAAISVSVAGFLVALTACEWIVILLCVGLVISAECMNTALELLADRISPELHPLIKQAKDCGSAALLVLATTASLVGLIVFIPKLKVAVGW